MNRRKIFSSKNHQHNRKYILICTNNMDRWKWTCTHIAKSFEQFGDFNFEFKKIKEISELNPNKYSLVISLFWDSQQIKKDIWNTFLKNKIPIIFLSDGVFFYKKKKTVRDFYNYPLTVFINGPQSAPFGDKHYRNDLPNNRIKLFSPEIDLKPWRTNWNHILVTYQNGVSYTGENKKDAYIFLINKLQTITNIPIKLRMHPHMARCGNEHLIKSLRKKINCDIEIPNDIELSNCLNNVYALVTYGGKSAAKAVINGIPTFTLATTIAEMVTDKNLKNIKNPKFPDRQPWLNWLSYCHWTLNEMISGDCWKFYLEQKYLKL